MLREIKTEEELREALDLCYSILGQNDSELYGYAAWRQRFLNGAAPLAVAWKDGKIVSAVLGRAENPDSLVIGFVACHPDYRRQGITRSLMGFFEELARQGGYRYITLGSQEDAFYEKCGYYVAFQIHDQNIYQKVLPEQGPFCEK